MPDNKDAIMFHIWRDMGATDIHRNEHKKSVQNQTEATEGAAEVLHRSFAPSKGGNRRPTTKVVANHSQPSVQEKETSQAASTEAEEVDPAAVEREDEERQRKTKEKEDARKAAAAHPANQNTKWM